MKRFANFHFIDLERFIETDVTEREMTQKNPTARELLRKNLDFTERDIIDATSLRMVFIQVSFKKPESLADKTKMTTINAKNV